MKKMLALLLALVLALSCTLALAETTETTSTTDTASAPVFNGLTIESEYDVDREALKNVLTQFGLDESLVTIVDTIAAVIDQYGDKLVICKDGFQADMLLQGNSLVNLVGLIGEKGVTIGSNLIPSYALDISYEEIGAMMLSKLQERAEVMNSLDVDGLKTVLTEYMNDYVNTCTSAIIPGEVEQGDYVMDGISYNVMMPMKVDLPTIVDATNELVYNLSNDETIQTALAQLALMGVDVKFDALEEGYTIVDPAYLPSVAVEVYMNVDEKGAQNGPTQVSVYVVPAGETNPATTVITKVNGNNVTVDAQFVSGKDNINVIYAMDRDPADPFGLNGRVDAYVNDLYFGLAAVTASNGQSITFDAYEYVLDTEKAVAEEHGSVVLDGALTMGVSDKATHITLADLTGDNADDVIGGLTSDLSGGALSIVMSIASTVPEIGALMGQLMGNANAPAA